MAGVLLGGVAVAVWWTLRPGTLHVQPWPGGEVLVDGDSLGQAPIEALSIASGTHEIRIRMTGFVEHVEEIDLAAGGSVAVSPHLRAVNPADPATRRIIEDRVGFRLDLPRVPRERNLSGFEGDALLIRPRGKVRRSDLVEFRAELNQIVDGRIVIVDADGGEVWGTAAPGQNAKYKLDFPPDLDLADGKHRWGFVFGSGKKVLIDFEVVPGIEDRIADLRALLNPDDEKTARLFEIGLLQREGLHIGALRAGSALAVEWPDPVVYALMWKSLVELGLEESALAADVRSRHG